MKNIDKYTETKSALKAWEKYHDEGGDMLFAAWADEEYIEPRPPTLLEAAEKLIVGYVENWSEDLPSTCLENLLAAVKREKQKPVRNCDMCRTAKEAYDGFRKICYGNACSNCRFRDCETPFKCVLEWLYSDADKEETK